MHDTNYAATKALVQARIAAYDAKANESLTLVYQGAGQAFEKAYGKDLATAARAVGGRPAGRRRRRRERSALGVWNAGHEKIRAADDGGNWKRRRRPGHGSRTRSSATSRTPRRDALRDGGARGVRRADGLALAARAARAG